MLMPIAAIEIRHFAAELATSARPDAPVQPGRRRWRAREATAPPAIK